MSRPKGPFGIDPLAFSFSLFGLLLLFVLYLLLPRALRKQYFGAYPRRHAWSARSRARRGRGYGDVSSISGTVVSGFCNDGVVYAMSCHVETRRNDLISSISHLARNA